MILFFAAAVVILVFGAGVQQKLSYDPSAFSRERTSALNGFFVLLVFLSHAVTYAQLSGPLDSVYLFVKLQLDQLVVAPFLFFSGYGVLCSFRNQGKDYLRRFPLHRFTRVLAQSELAVLLFLLTDFLIGKRYPLSRVLLSFTFWENIGNSNWYLFVVLALYVLVFVSFSLFQNRLAAAVSSVSVLSVLLVFVLRFAGKDPWWYNTLLLFPLGMWFALCKPWLEAKIFRNTARTLLALAACFGAFLGLHFLRGKGFVFYELWAAAFMGCDVLVMTRVRFENRLLRFFGRHVFGIFILQRIPMLVFSHLGLTQYRYLFVALCFAATVVLAVGFDALIFRLLERKQKS